MLTKCFLFKTKILFRTYAAPAGGPADVKNFVKNARKVIGVSANYVEVVKSTNKPIPKAPVLFQKTATSLINEGSNIVLPKTFARIEYEVELGVIINKKGRNVKLADAMGYVGGYCVALDLTAQDELGEARKKGLPWLLAKGFDTATPVSALIPKDVIKDPHVLDIWLNINGESRQKGNTKSLIFQVPDLIEYTSIFMTLEPNDLIITGTPLGANKLNPGDVIEAGLGKIKKVKFSVG